MSKLMYCLLGCLQLSASLQCSIAERIQKVHHKIDAYEKIVKAETVSVEIQEKIESSCYSACWASCRSSCKNCVACGTIY